MKDKTKVLKTYRDFVRQTAIYLPNWGGGVIGGRVFNPRQQQA